MYPQMTPLSASLFEALNIMFRRYREAKAKTDRLKKDNERLAKEIERLKDERDRLIIKTLQTSSESANAPDCKSGPSG